MKVALYARVSTTNGQDPTMQTRELKEYCERRGWKLAGEYVDTGISGAKEKRPELDRLMADAHRRRFDAVVVWKFDRFARSVSHLLRALETFKALGIEFVSLSEDSHLEQRCQRKKKVEAEIDRLTQAIADGHSSQSILAAIGEREKELREITDKLLERRPGSLRASLEELRTFAVSRLTNLRALLAHPGSVNEARALLSEQVGKITLWPVSDNGKEHYEAKGEVDFFGEERLVRVGGAGGRSCTISPNHSF